MTNTKTRRALGTVRNIIRNLEDTGPGATRDQLRFKLDMTLAKLRDIEAYLGQPKSTIDGHPEEL